MKKFIFFLVLFLFMYLDVSAMEVILVKDRLDDNYVYYYDSNLGRERYLEANIYLFGSDVGYCLELGKSIESNIYQVVTSFEKLNISKEDLEYVKLVSYYGYDYPGHRTDNYYMAAQELIWDRLSGVNIKWVKDLNPSLALDVSKEKNEIVALMEKHYVKPSFDKETLEFTLGEELVIEDNNKVLSMYSTSSDNVKIVGNKLVLEEDFEDEEIILTKSNYGDKDFFLYTSGSSQKMLSVGNLGDITSKINIEIIGGSIEINKLDKDNNSDIPSGEAQLIGAEYGLYNSLDELVDTFVIGKKEKVDKLPLGKYYLKEIMASTGYLLDLEVYNIEITKDKLDINLDVYEEVIKRKIDIFKVYASDETGILVGEDLAKFEIYNNNNELVDIITTDQDGYASIVLPYGKYTFKQVSGAEDYYKVDDFIVDVSIYDERPIYKLISNSEIKARLKVVKKDLETGKNIIESKFRFKIFDVRNNEFVSFKLTYPENRIIDEFEINKEGFFVTPDVLSSGEYILYEVDDVMDGYLYNKEGVSFSIGDDVNLINDDTYGVVVEIPFYNKRVKGKIVINKYGEEIVYKDDSYYYNKITLENTYFNVYAKEDIYENGILIYMVGEMVGEIITNKNGIGVLDNLPLGKYYMKEVKSNRGNVISNNIYDINLVYQDQYTEEIVYENDVYNYLEKGKLVINKFESFSNIRLQNTLIEIYTTDNKLVYKGYTDKNGQIIIDDLMYGQYYISEVEASSGYRILEDKIYFNLDKDSLDINIYNERIEVPNTGIKFNFFDMFLIFLIIVSVILIILFWDNKKILVCSFITISLSFMYFGYTSYRYFSDYYKNKKSIDVFLNNNIDLEVEDRYQYKALLDIPSIELKRGILDIESEYNDAKYNIELLSDREDAIILASHNGSDYNSYFGNLNKLEFGDYINYYNDNKMYKYIYSDRYEIKKNGYADIYRNRDKNSIILITCKDNDNDAQVVHIGYLKEINFYKDE